MRNLMIGLLLWMIFGISKGYGQQVVMTITRPEAKAFRSWQIVLHNPNKYSYLVYLYWITNSPNQGKVMEARSTSFEVLPGIHHLNFADYFLSHRVEKLYTSPEWSEDVFQSGVLPLGNYETCVSLFGIPIQPQLREATNTPQLLTQQCYTYTDNITSDQYLPPVLLAPIHGDTVNQPHPLFVWTPSMPSMAETKVDYLLRVYEVLPHQKPAAATLTNPVWYEVENLISPMQQYGVDARDLRKGSTYAWYIVAMIGGKQKLRSEIEYFIYDQPQEKPNPDPSDSTRVEQKEEQAGLVYFDLLPENQQGYYVLQDEMLHFIYVHEFPPDKVLFRIEDPAGVLLQQAALFADHGFNFYSLDLQKAGIQPEVFYSLVTQGDGRKQQLRFIYSLD